MTSAEEILNVTEPGELFSDNTEAAKEEYANLVKLRYVTSMHPRIDSFERRNKKGFLFTIGDERPITYLRGCGIGRVESV